MSSAYLVCRRYTAPLSTHTSSLRSSQSFLTSNCPIVHSELVKCWLNGQLFDYNRFSVNSKSENVNLILLNVSNFEFRETTSRTNFYPNICVVIYLIYAAAGNSSLWTLRFFLGKRSATLTGVGLSISFIAIDCIQWPRMFWRNQLSWNQCLSGHSNIFEVVYLIGCNLLDSMRISSRLMVNCASYFWSKTHSSEWIIHVWASSFY